MMPRTLPALGAVLILSALAWTTAHAAERCEPWAAKVVSVQGRVEARRAGEPRWVSVRLNDVYCAGDAIRVDERSRAAILLPNDVVLRLDQNTTISLSEPPEPGLSFVSVIRGVAHFISRIPRRLKVNTAFVDGGVEGTEFLVDVAADSATLTVFEGRVAAANAAGSVTVVTGQSAVALAGQAPVSRVVIRPRDAVQWALYYPPVMDYRRGDFANGPPGSWQEMVRRSIEAYRDGDLARAFSEIQGVPPDIKDPRFYTYRAALLLTVGRVDEASVDIAQALALDPRHSRAVALQAIIAVTRNEKGEALRQAQRAVQLDPASAVARVALSYAHQADFDLKGALASVEQAVKLGPDNSLAWARLSELHLSFANLSKALDAARKAVQLNPKLARTQSVLGFAHLSRIKTKAAKRAFEAAIVLDSADPLARLGLGLATIREGALESGRREIEIAVSLDPGRSILRSYLGKGYYDERRDQPAKEEFATAKELDPKDPTPWLYDAIRKQSVNRPVEALRDLQTSIELNDNRAIYRSRLLLDEDRATRSASLGRTFDDLGFQQLALVEGWKSVNADPTSYSAHRFLSDSYAALPRHEIARVSELLQAQLLQPVNINPVQPQLAFSTLGILSGTGLTTPAFNEYTYLFERNRLALLLSGIAGDHGTAADELVQSGVLGPFSYSLGQYHHETNGFRRNNDLNLDIFDGFAQLTLVPSTSIQAEVRSLERRQGDRNLLFDPDDFFPELRVREDTDIVRLGFRHAFSPNSTLLGSFSRQDQTINERDFFPGIALRTTVSGYSAELQHLSRSGRINSVLGAGYFPSDFKRILDVFGVKDVVSDFKDIEHTTLYEYLQINVPDTVAWTVGVSLDVLNHAVVDREQLNPKVGVTWTPIPGTTLRVAGFRTLKRQLISNQTLEPTQVAGFNQFFDDHDATRAWRYGVGVDQKLTAQLFLGGEWSRRDLDVPFEFVKVSTGEKSVEEAEWKEQLGRAYVYWTPHPWLAVSGEYQFEELRRELNFVGDELFGYLQTHRVPVGIRGFHPSGLSAGIKATYVDQRGRFGDPESGPLVKDDDQFVLVDASVGYRLPKRLGLLSIEVRNLFDTRLKFQDTDPANPSLFPERLVFGRLTLAF